MLGRLQSADRIVILLLTVLCCFGLVMVYSSSFAVAAERFTTPMFFVKNQAVRLFIGMGALLVFLHIDYHIWVKYSRHLYILSIVLLIYVLMPWIEPRNGARRWLSIMGTAVQVSEIARIAIVIYLSSIMGRMGLDTIREKGSFFLVLGMGFFPIALVAAGPDLGSSLVIAGAVIGLMFIGGAKKRYLLMLFLITIAAGWIYVGKAEYRLNRVRAFIDRSENIQSINWQAYQAANAIGNGGIVGRGLGRGIQKRHFLPEPHTDFIYASIAEEFGFIGMIILSALFLTLFVRGFRIAKSAPDREGQLLASGITLLIMVNYIAHTAVNVGFIPTTGMPLPFMSYGGMSLIIVLGGLGILLNISSQANYEGAQ